MTPLLAPLVRAHDSVSGICLSSASMRERAALSFSALRAFSSVRAASCCAARDFPRAGPSGAAPAGRAVPRGRTVPGPCIHPIGNCIPRQSVSHAFESHFERGRRRWRMIAGSVRMHGKPVQCRRCPRNGKRALKIANRHCRPPGPREGGDLEPLASPETVPSPRTGEAPRGAPPFRYLQPAGTLAARLKDPSRMNRLPTPASSARQPGTHAQWPQPLLHRNLDRSSSRPPARWARDITTLRDTVVITGEELRAEGPLSLAELLQKRAGVEIRSTAAPASRPASSCGAPAPRRRWCWSTGCAWAPRPRAPRRSRDSRGDDRRIEVVKGALSSLYGSEAIGGVVQIFTRGKSVPHLFASAAYGNDNDRRAAAGLATADATTHASLSLGARKVDAPSATNPRAPFGVHEPIAVPTRTPSPRCASRSGCGRARPSRWKPSARARALTSTAAAPRTAATRRSSAGRITSSVEDPPGLGGNLSVGHSRDELAFAGPFPAHFVTPPGPGHLDPRPRHARGQPRRGRRVRAPARSSPGERSGRAHLRARPPRHEVGVRLLERDVARAARRGERAPRRGRAVRLAQYRRREASPARRPTAARARSSPWRALPRPHLNDLYLTFRAIRPNPICARSAATAASSRCAAPGGPVSEWRLTGSTTASRTSSCSRPRPARCSTSPARACAAWSCGSRRSGSHEVARRVYRAAPEDEETGARLQTRASRIGSLEASRAWGA